MMTNRIANSLPPLSNASPGVIDDEDQVHLASLHQICNKYGFAGVLKVSLIMLKMKPEDQHLVESLLTAIGSKDLGEIRQQLSQLFKKGYLKLEKTLLEAALEKETLGSTKSLLDRLYKEFLDLTNKQRELGRDNGIQRLSKPSDN